MKKKHIFISFCIIFLFFLSFLSLNRYRVIISPLKEYKIIGVKIKNKSFTLFIADSEEKKNKGLSQLSKIKDTEGMLFTFSKPDYYFFWMKDMQFSLDFIFMNGNTVVAVLNNVEPGTYPQAFSSPYLFDKAIELSAGQVKRLDLQVGEIISFKSL
ncbi:MAG TPA: DUF192 domain-containing protein [Patescibacteria group bacterium]|nr:DUF192 domain-containing protein [Patescibacteria group bacterium]